MRVSHCYGTDQQEVCIRGWDFFAAGSAPVLCVSLTVVFMGRQQLLSIFETGAGRRKSREWLSMTNEISIIGWGFSRHLREVLDIHSSFTEPSSFAEKFIYAQITFLVLLRFWNSFKQVYTLMKPVQNLLNGARLHFLRRFQSFLKLTTATLQRRCKSFA